MLELDKIYYGNCADTMKELDDNSIDLTVTSPPYDSLRKYHGYVFDFEGIAQQLFRITKSGGVVVWVVGDATIDGSETGTSFRQALYFKEIGFKLHDTMIWEKPGFTATGALVTRYAQVFEYMFIFSKDKIETFNPIKDRTTRGARKLHGTIRQSDGTTRSMSNQGKIYGDGPAQRFNVWRMNSEVSNDNRFHPGQFPEDLARDHILSWSNPDDLILDPMCGSGTTCKMAKYHQRHFLGIDISEEYCEIARKRVAAVPARLDRWAEAAI